MKYRIALRRTEEGYSVSCPSLPGCWSQGATEQEGGGKHSIRDTGILAGSRGSLRGREREANRDHRL